MIDREKVIKVIEICYILEHNCTECPLFPEDDYCNDKLMHDAVVMLREQEAEIRQLRLALDIVKGTCEGIFMEGQ